MTGVSARAVSEALSDKELKRVLGRVEGFIRRNVAHRNAVSSLMKGVRVRLGLEIES